MKNTLPNKLQIALRGSCDVVRWILASQFRVLRTGTLSEIRPDNMYQPLALIKSNDNLKNNLKTYKIIDAFPFT